MNLPTSDNLPINKLVSVFANTSATYKFYWFLAILELVEEGNTTIPKRKIFARMLSNSWYTVNYFQVSFGKQDLIQEAVRSIQKLEKLTIDENKSKINAVLENSTNPTTIKLLNHFDLNVPHWFISPWFLGNRNTIYSLSNKFDNDCLYSLEKDFITINPIWTYYLKSNSKLLKDFCYWNLSLFLQKRNPNVPDIPNKLIKPATRSSLAVQTKDYWKLVFNELGSIPCIFTDTKLIYEEKNFALDHFIPHAFVSHDLIWNLLPIERKFNSSKSDKLPLFDKHFDKFYNLQKLAFDINKQHNSKSKYMDEFLTIFHSIDEFEKETFSNTIQPLLTIASNNGFLYLKD
jgi:hypothetical protein